MAESNDLKRLTVRSVKWNVVDKLSTQILYALTGIILARLIAPEEFGLIGAVLVFQAFAALFVDSGFASALIQRKEPDERDYSTIFWFNMLMAVGLYALIWLCAPLIDQWFHSNGRLIPLTRISFLSVILNATGIVQVNRMVKQMDVKPVAIANGLGLLLGGIAGIGLALHKPNAWALVWQQIITAGAKSAILWIIVRWRPLFVCSLRIIRGFFAVGFGVMIQSILNVVFQNIYSFFIGNRLGMVSLGNYTQADKWSKMGSSSISAILTSSFLPALSAVQDQPHRFAGIAGKIHRTTIAIVIIGFGWLVISAESVFHALLGSQWDRAIPLFQLLMLRGIFVVLSSLYCNFILAVGKPKLLVAAELVRNSGALIALVATIPFWGQPNGLEIMIWGQIAASAITFLVIVVMTARVTYRRVSQYFRDFIPFMGYSAIPLSLSYLLIASYGHLNPWFSLMLSISPIALYLPLYRLKKL